MKIFTEFSDNYGLELMGQELMKVVHIENLFHLLIFFIYFFFNVFIICARLKQSVGQIRFCFYF